MSKFKIILGSVLIFMFSTQIVAEDRPKQSKSKPCEEVLVLSPLEQTSFQALDLEYTRAAKALLPEVVNDLKRELLKFQWNGYLQKDSKNLRKKVLVYRVYFEFFSFAFSSSDQEDYWLRSWSLLKEGYSLLAKYKEANKRDLKRLKVKRQKAVEWTERALTSFDGLTSVMLFQGQVDQAAGNVRSTLPEGIQWDPSVLGSPLGQQVRSLSSSTLEKLLAKSIELLPAVYALPNFNDSVEAEDFHDFRKLLRVVLKFKSIFPGVYADSDHATELELIVWEIGKINDQVEKLQKSIERQSKGTADLQKTIDDLWVQFKTTHSENKIKSILEQIQ